MRSRTSSALRLMLACCAFVASASIPASAASPAVAPAATAPVEIRFSPDRVYPHELDGRRGLQSILMQNMAIVSRQKEPVLIDAIEFELLAASGAAGAETTVVTDVRRLGADAIAQAAARGAGIEKAGMLQLFGFHFQPERLLAGATLSATPALAPGSALLLGHQVFTYSGARSAVRVRVWSGGAEVASGLLPIRVAPATVDFGFPLAGRWFVAASASLHHHHRWVAPEEFALDIARIGEGNRTHRGDGGRSSDYFAYGEPVLAGADGTVVKVRWNVADNDQLLRRAGETDAAYEERIVQAQGTFFMTEGAEAAAGNFVFLDHGQGIYSLSAHLRPPALGAAAAAPPLAVGAKVRRGQVIGYVGNSGLSTEPHLHFHVVDGPDPLHAAGVPVHFNNVRLFVDGVSRALQSGDLVEAEW